MAERIEAKGNKNVHFVYFALNINIDDTDNDNKTYHFPEQINLIFLG
ncbi:hypothetical protein [Chryseobacterium indoltheticum]